MKTLKFAYLSAENPKNKKVWSGTHYSIYKSLQSLGSVDILGPFQPSVRLFISKVLNQLALRFFKKRISYRHSLLISKSYAYFFSQQLKNKDYDYIIAPAASGEIAFLKTEIPIIYITDGTFASCINYHESLTNLTKKSISEGDLVEQAAINKSKYIIVPSEWCARSIKNDYQKNSENVFVIPYGANFENLPSEQNLVFDNPIVWKLLFVGVYWNSKGGDIAVNAYHILLEKGYRVTLTIVGCTPPDDLTDTTIKIIPFIDKNDKDGQDKLSEIYKEHHFLILPTRFDCSPIVINEASAFGIPSIVADTGGVRGHLHEGLNGYLVDYADKGEKYASIVSSFILDPAKYIALRQSTRKEYVDKLNWHNWTSEFKKLIS